MIGENNFITKVENKDILVFGVKVDKETNYDTACFGQVEWEFYTEMRSWGVKQVGVYGTNAFLTLELNLWGEDEDTLKTIEIDTTKDGWEIETESDDICFNSGVYPTGVDVDLENKIV